MPVSFSPFYYDGTSFATSTGLFEDADLTTPAPAGTYRLGSIYRIWDGTSLSPVYTCDSCCQPICNVEAPFTGVFNVTQPDNYKDTICTRSRTTGTYVIEFDFSGSTFEGFPMGFDVEYNGTTYTTRVSNRYGVITTRYTGSDNFTPTPIVTGGSAYTLTERSWQPATVSFQLGTTTVSETIAASNIDLKDQSPEKCYMVVPKPFSAPTELNAYVYSPRETSWDGAGQLAVTVGCPAALPSFGSSDEPVPLRSDVCDQTIDTTFYHAVVNGEAGTPRLYDMIFTDQLGQTPAANGYYAVDGGRWIQVLVGVVISSGVGCRSGSILTDMIATPSAATTANGTCGLTPNTVYYHDGVNALPIATDTIYTDPSGTTTMNGGWYQLQEEYKIIEVNNSGVVQSFALYPC